MGSTFETGIHAVQQSSEINQVKEDHTFKKYFMFSKLCSSSLFMVLQSETEGRKPTSKGPGSIMEAIQVILD